MEFWGLKVEGTSRAANMLNKHIITIHLLFKSIISAIEMSSGNEIMDFEPAPNLHVVHESIPYGDAIRIRNCEGLAEDAVAEGAEANRRFRTTQEEEILAVAPESLATAMRLSSMRMVAITLQGAPSETLADVASDIGVDLDTYSLLVFGNPPQNSNHSIQEYTAGGNSK
jgi:hypothetical protein